MSGAPAPARSSGDALAAGAPAVLVEGLVKRYGEVEAVSGVDFQVSVGETYFGG